MTRKKISSTRLRLSEFGEFGLIRRIARRCGAGRRRPGVLAGLGDDAFVAKLASTRPLAVSTDTLLEETHFSFDLLSRFMNAKAAAQAIGYKALAVNFSDLAAMGSVQPRYIFVTLGLHGDISVDTVDNLYTGLLKCARPTGAFVAGGDIIRSEKTMISITVLGQLLSPVPIPRSGARNGQVLLASGPLGLSAAGLDALRGRLRGPESGLKILIDSHLFPRPQLAEGRILSKTATLATSLMDTSDDLITSLEILGEKSRAGFELELASIPIHPALVWFCRKTGRSPLQYLLYGGEDYRLLFTVEPKKVEAIRKEIPSAVVLGAVRPRRFGIQVRINGKPVRLRDARFRHF